MKVIHSGFYLRHIQNIVNQLKQKFGIGFDNTGILQHFFFIFYHRKQIRETDNGIERSTYLMTHISQKGRLKLIGFLGFQLRFFHSLMGSFKNMNIIAYGTDHHQQQDNSHQNLLLILLEEADRQIDVHSLFRIKGNRYVIRLQSRITEVSSRFSSESGRNVSRKLTFQDTMNQL